MSNKYINARKMNEVEECISKKIGQNILEVIGKRFLSDWELMVMFYLLFREIPIEIPISAYVDFMAEQESNFRIKRFVKWTARDIKNNGTDVGERPVKLLFDISPELLKKYYQQYYSMEIAFVDKAEGKAIWKDYIIAYQDGLLFSNQENENFYPYQQSMDYTLDILAKFEQANPKRFFMRRKNICNGQCVQISGEGRLLEDLYILHEMGALVIQNVDMDEIIDKFLKGEELSPEEQAQALHPFPVLEIELNDSVALIRQKLKFCVGYLGIQIMGDDDIFYNGKKLEFGSRARFQKALVKLLVEKQGRPMSRQAVFDALGYTSKSKKAPKNRLQQTTVGRGVKGKVDKRKANRLKDLIKQVLAHFPKGEIMIQNTLVSGVFLIRGKK